MPKDVPSRRLWMGPKTVSSLSMIIGQVVKRLVVEGSNFCKNTHFF